MCLERIDPKVAKKFKRNKRGDVIAWRIFYHKDGELRPRFNHFSHQREPRYAESCWHTDKHGFIKEPTGPPYPRGFHAYASRAMVTWAKGAFAARRVLLGGVMTFGWQDGHPVVAASKMFICKGDPK